MESMVFVKGGIIFWCGGFPSQLELSRAEAEVQTETSNNFRKRIGYDQNSLSSPYTYLCNNGSCMQVQCSHLPTLGLNRRISSSDWFTHPEFLS